MALTTVSHTRRMMKRFIAGLGAKLMLRERGHPMGRSVSISDVARAAGVSVGTVSNVLNGKRSVAPEYHARVQRAIDKLDFVPNDNARQLKKGASDTVGFLVLSTFNPFFSALAEATQEEAEAQGLSLVLGSSAQSLGREDSYITLFEKQRVRGLIVAPVKEITPHMVEFHRRYPLVVLGDEADSTNFCCVSLDSEASGHLAVSHLLETGRTRLALVGGPFDHVARRIAGAQRAAESAGARIELIDTSELTVAAGQIAARRILERPADQRPDGVFAASDLVGIGLMHTLIAAGMSVPRDVGVIGHDDIEFASTSLVSLSSISQPVSDIARATLQLLLVDDPSEQHQHQHLLFPPRLVRRASTARVT